MDNYNRPGLKFQSTLPRGERPVALFIFPIFSIFQSTLPRGERLVYFGQGE